MWREKVMIGSAWILLGVLGHLMASKDYCSLKDKDCESRVWELGFKHGTRCMRAWALITWPLLTVPYILSETLQTHGIQIRGILRDTPISMVNWSRIFYGLCGCLLVGMQGNNVARLSREEVSGEYTWTVWENSPVPDQTGYQVDPDIAGPGVRLSTYILLAFTALSLAIGSCHAATTGTKELGVCTLLNLFGMSFNMAKLNHGTLSPTEVFVIIGLMDAQITSLSSVLSSKDALASRLFVKLTLACQLLAWLSVTIVSSRLSDTKFYSTGSISCRRDAGFADGDQPFDVQRCDFAMHLATIFPYYWYIRSIDLIQPVWLAWEYMSPMDAWEKLHNRESTGAGTASESSVFGRLPATAFSNWAGLLIPPFAIIVAIERQLAAIGQSNFLDWQAWGQSLTLIVCIGGISHWFYVNRALLAFWMTMGFYGDSAHADDMLPVDVLRKLAMGWRMNNIDVSYTEPCGGTPSTSSLLPTQQPRHGHSRPGSLRRRT